MRFSFIYFYIFPFLSNVLSAKDTNNEAYVFHFTQTQTHSSTHLDENKSNKNCSYLYEIQNYLSSVHSCNCCRWEFFFSFCRVCVCVWLVIYMLVQWLYKSQLYIVFFRILLSGLCFISVIIGKARDTIWHNWFARCGNQKRESEKQS